MSKANKHKHKPRQLTHPGVVKIMAAIDRAIASPFSEDGLVMSVAGDIITRGNIIGWFDGGPDSWRWSNESLRALILAYATLAPDGEFRDLIKLANKRYKWVEWWDREGHDESHGLKAEPEERAA